MKRAVFVAFVLFAFAGNALAQGFGLPALRKGKVPSWIRPGLVVYYTAEGGTRGGGTGSYLTMQMAYVVWEVEGERVLGLEVQASPMGVIFAPKLLGTGGDGLFWVDPERVQKLLEPRALEEARRQGIAISGRPGMIAVEYSPQRHGVSKAAITYDTGSGLVLSREECTWSGREVRGSTCSKLSYAQKGTVRLLRPRDFPLAASRAATYWLQMTEPYTGITVPSGNIQVQPVRREGRLMRYRVVTVDPNTGAPLPAKEGFGISAMGPHYVHPLLVRMGGVELVGMGLEVRMEQSPEGITVTTLWNGAVWSSEQVDPGSGLIVSFQNRTYGGVVSGTVGR